MTTRRDFLQTTAALAATLALPGWIARAAEPAARPNILLILADDLGLEALSCYGGTRYKTPHIDALAAGGLRFEQAFAQPLCTPTRVQLMTGQYNVRNYVGFGTLAPGERTFANHLRDAGYATCIAGKWQLGGDLKTPAAFGFDEYTLNQLTDRPSGYRNPDLAVNGEVKRYSNGEYGPDLFNAHIRDFITRHRGRPWLAYYPMILPHTPHEPTPDSADYATYTATDRQRGDARYLPDMIAYMDKLVGQVVATLESLKLRENTLVVFMGDNGSHRVGKGKATDAGTHVPCIANWPGTIAANRTTADMLDTTDFLPTLCDLAGVTVPRETVLDGRSVAPQLRGQAGTAREWTYCWYAKYGGPTPDAEYARDTRFVLHRDGRLYDLQAATRETTALPATTNDPAAIAARARLQPILDRYANARPAAVSAAAPPADERPQKGKRRGRN